MSKKHDFWKASRCSNKSNKWVQIWTGGDIAVNDWILLLAGVPEAATRAKRIRELERGKLESFMGANTPVGQGPGESI